MTGPVALRVVVVAGLVLAYYAGGKAAVFAGCRRLANRVAATGRHSHSEVVGVVELSGAAASHVAFVALLLAVLGLSPRAVGLGSVPLVLVVLGAAVGVGEFALSELVCRVLVEAFVGAGSVRRAPALAPAPPTVEGWIALARGGWVRHHLRTFEVVPLPLAFGISAAQVASEETVFRGVVLTALRPAGTVVAVGVSLGLFVVMQAFFTAGWRGAMFPVVGALVMGVVHTALFLAVPVLLPLVVAHLVFFAFAVL